MAGIVLTLRFKNAFSGCLYVGNGDDYFKVLDY
jgi:hypothetical protein